VVEAVLHLLEVEREHAPGYPAVIVQPMLGETPESLNAVDVDGPLSTFANERLGMLQGVVLAIALEGVVAPELVGVVDRALAGLPADDVHEHLLGDRVHHLGIHPPIPLQKPEYDTFARSPSAALALPPAAEVGLIELDLARQSPRLPFTLLDDRQTKPVVDAFHRLVWNLEVERRQERGLLATERRDDQDFPLQPFQALLAPAVPALPVSPPRPICLAMTAERALPTEEI